MQVDDRGISLVMGIVAAAVDPRKAPATPKILQSEGINISSIPRDTDLRVGVAPGVLRPLTRMLIQEDVAHVNVLDIPDKAFAAFADRKALSEILPDVASLPANAEIRAELVLAEPISIRDAKGESSEGGAASDRMAEKHGEGVRVTALKANPDAPNAGAATQGTPADSGHSKAKSPAAAQKSANDTRHLNSSFPRR